MAIKGVKSVETKYMEEREALFKNISRLGRRDFAKAAGISAAVVASKGLVHPHSFQLVDIAKADGANGAGNAGGFTFAYISDTHLYKKTLNDRFVRSILRAVDDVNALNPQPDFVFFGGDLAQLGAKEELDLGAQILKSVKAPVKMMVGEHDWFFDMGQHWQQLFGAPSYSFDHKGVHFAVLMSVNEKDFWTQRGFTPEQRMQTVRRSRQRHPVALRGRRRRPPVAEERPRQGRRQHPGGRLSPTRRCTSTTATGTSGPRMPTRCSTSSPSSRR